MRILNLFAGIGGNRKLWEGEVTAVEKDPRIATLYKRLHPKDKVIETDAHAFLLENYDKFDFIWSSPPCQTHSKMCVATRHKLKRYPDLTLYQEIIFLKQFSKCFWVVENVVPYYTPLIEGRKIGRHLFWSNFDFPGIEIPRPTLGNLAYTSKKVLMDWLGIHYPENICYGYNHCPAQILRNCVHPLLGKHIYGCFMEAMAADPAFT